LSSIFDLLITEPLRAFYFNGPIWWNLSNEQVCFELTGVDGSWWKQTPDRYSQCESLLHTRFTSFEVTILCLLYFIAMGSLVAYIVCRCCFL